MPAGFILIVDDEASIREALRATLSSLGFRVLTAARGEDGLSLVRTNSFDAVLLDVNMPGVNGIEACRRIRELCPKVGILMLTVCDNEADMIAALDVGADDYITKPFQLRELVARIRAVIRRVLMHEEDPVLRIGQIELDPARRTVKKSSLPIHLSPKEFELMHQLMIRAGRPISHARLLNAVWGPEYCTRLEYLRTFMYQLRKKIEDDSLHPQYLITDPGLGYRFAERV